MAQTIEDLLDAEEGYKVEVTDDGNIHAEADKGTDVTLTPAEVETIVDGIENGDAEDRIDVNDEVDGLVGHDEGFVDVNLGETGFDIVQTIFGAMPEGEHYVSLPQGVLEDALDAAAAEA